MKIVKEKLPWASYTRQKILFKTTVLGVMTTAKGRGTELNPTEIKGRISNHCGDRVEQVRKDSMGEAGHCD